MKIPKSYMTYTKKPSNSQAYTRKMDRIYTRYAKAYDGFMFVFPLWKKWLCSVLPYIRGNKILDVSFGPAYLLSVIPGSKKLYGIDYNHRMVIRAKAKMKQLNRKVSIKRGNVEALPYKDDYFDTVINTMAFSGYPDGNLAMKEMLRVLKPEGILLILDYDYPKNLNLLGFLLVKLIEKSGDIIKDIGLIAKNNKATYHKQVIGGFGSIQLFIIQK